MQKVITIILIAAIPILMAFQFMTTSTSSINSNQKSFQIGDFNGDGKDDIFSYQSNICGADMLLSTGNLFRKNICWTKIGANFSHGGWHIGDFNGDGKDDIFKYKSGSCGASVLLSNGASFKSNGCWTKIGANFSHGGWYVGDFNGDGKDDIFKYKSGSCGASVLLSNGTSFVSSGCWTKAGVNFSKGGWYIGDFNGDGKDDIFRYKSGEAGADVFLSNGSTFIHSGKWTGAGVDFSKGGWHIGDFNGDGKDDIFRYQSGKCAANTFLSKGNSFGSSTCWATRGGNDFSIKKEEKKKVIKSGNNSLKRYRDNQGNPVLKNISSRTIRLKLKVFNPDRCLDPDIVTITLSPGGATTFRTNCTNKYIILKSEFVD